MLLITILSITTLASASCPIPPTNSVPCPIWIQSTATEAQFDLTRAVEADPAGGEPLLALSQDVNIYFENDGNLVM